MKTKIQYYILCLIFGLSTSSCTLKSANIAPIIEGDDEIIARIDAHRPSKGATIPSDIKRKLGASHVASKYFLTPDPIIIEGCKKMDEMGFGVVKLWFTKNLDKYYFNSNWNMPGDYSLEDLAEHAYYQECFDMPFSTIILLLEGAATGTNDQTAQAEENEFYRLTKYLLERYKDRDIEFILQNWEGDWLYREGMGTLESNWSKNPAPNVSSPIPSDIERRSNAMIKWFNARQKGVDRARSEINGSKCKVYHAIETNKVLDAMNGIPGIVNNVLPHVKSDMVSWSAYDGMRFDGNHDKGLELYKGLKYIESKHQPTIGINKPQKVYIGELGVPEKVMLMRENTMTYNLDSYMGVCIALNVPYLVYWQLYCNEPHNNPNSPPSEVLSADQLNGYWLIKPDGNLSIAGQYYSSILNNAGGTISNQSVSQ